MATILNNPITREIADWSRKGLFGLGGSLARPLIVTMEPGPILSFREKGRRKRYDIDIESVFMLAVHQTLKNEKADKAKAAKKRRRR